MKSTEPTEMPIMLQVAAGVVTSCPADDQMAFLVCLLARLALLNQDNPELAGKYEVHSSNLETTIAFLQAVKDKVDAAPETALNDDEESSEYQS